MRKRRGKYSNSRGKKKVLFFGEKKKTDEITQEREKLKK